MTYKTEFPDYDDTISLPEGWADDSWHNDVCPKIIKGAVVIWCDYKNPERRETMGHQFIVSMNIDDGYEPIREFDTFADALAFATNKE